MTQLHNQVRLSELVKRMKLETVFQSTDYEGITISEMDLNRPGLQLSGYMGNFPYKRLQIIGRVEYNYYMEMPPNKRYERFRGIFSYPIPALIYSYNQEITRDILDLADYYNKTVLRSPLPTTKLIADMNGVLEDIMAPETTIHAGLMEVFGAGVLIRGKSAVGKSETGLDLVIRGHRLVADDVVNIRRIDNRLIGSAPENIRHYMEIRGLGILDIRRLYGVGSVKEDADIELVIDLEDWDENKEYDRLGLTEDYTDILGVSVPQIIVPVKPGRNISMIIEVATRNNRQKQLGYNAAVDLNRRLIEEANRMNGVTD
ncbi:MAG: HPr(Ser) kinase/phosphatase [Peptoniphilaceae bacterium]|nr:HPr(Ser) kinase/phosphatase [Peptoniphilaceae bacterium]MDY5766489.1 HPr(Ser) kinase/phosphatase [Peptoniphilaceae bacterium]